MNAKRDRVFKELFKALYQANNKGTSGYDTTAEVVRVEGDTVWVHIAGGVDETPVKKTIDAVKGDTVQLRVSGGTAWIVGNESKPPTDDRVANVAQKTAENADLKAILAKKTADEASKVATNYIDFTEEDGLTVGHKSLESKVNISGGGVKLYDEEGKVGTEIKSGEAVFGAEDTNRLTLTEDGIALTDLNGVEVLSTGIADSAEQATVREIVNSSEYKLKHNPNVGSRITWTVITHIGGTHTQYTFYFTQGVPNHWGSGNLGTVYYDGDKTFTGFLGNNTNTLTYTSTLTPLFVTFGTRTASEVIANQDVQYPQGKYSMTFGKELIAEHFQIAMGQANDVDENGDYAFIFGNGVINSNPSIAPIRSNAMAMDWEGNVRLKGDVYVGCNGDSTGGRKVTSQAQGQVLTVSGVTSQSYKDYAVTFPTPYASTPLVVAGLAGTLTAYGMGMVSVAVNNVTTTGFTARVYNASSNDRNVTFRYIAIAP